MPGGFFFVPMRVWLGFCGPARLDSAALLC